jgi:streptomycin 6-kinase
VHGDFNPGNVLSADREPWLAIDAKPMIGDPGYDPSPLLLQVDDPLKHPEPVLQTRFRLFADAVGEPIVRLVAWSVAREVEAALWYASRDEIDDGIRTMGNARTLADLL